MMKLKPIPSDAQKFYQAVEAIGSNVPTNILTYEILGLAVRNIMFRTSSRKAEGWRAPSQERH